MTQKSPNRHGNHGASVSAGLSGTAARLFRLYEQDARVRLSQRSAPEYATRVHAFLSWLTDKGLELTNVRRGDVESYQQHWHKKLKPSGASYSVGAQNNHMNAVKHFFHFLCRRGYLLSDPASVLRLPRQDQTLPRLILTSREVLRILAAPDIGTPRGLRDKAILETIYSTGIRTRELAKLTPNDVDTDDRVLRVLQGKGGKDRHVPLTRPAANGSTIVKTWLARSVMRSLARAVRSGRIS